MKLKNIISDVIGTMRARLRLPISLEEKSNRELLVLIDDARREWQAAREYFDSISDADLIEHAVYMYHATEKRYMYLLNQARSRGLSSSVPLPKNDRGHKV